MISVLIFVYSTRYSCQILMNHGIFSADFREILKYLISWKFFQWEPSCSNQTDRQTDMTKLIVAFRNFAKAPKNPLPVKGNRTTVPQSFSPQPNHYIEIR